MRLNHLIQYIFLFIIPILGQSQEQIKGRVLYADKKGNEIPLPGANVYWDDLSGSTSADEQGFFTLKRNPGGRVVASFLGYVNDTLAEKGRTHFHFVLKPSSEVLEEVEIESQSTFISRVDPTHTEYISARELTKAPCCNLSESFETNASVDVSTADAVSGTKQIQMLGLSGKYSPLVRENIPVFNGLLVNKGLQLIPGTSVQGIAISKGPGSVNHGYNSMTGMINFDLIKPETGNKLFLNLFGSSIGRAELNLNGNVEIGDSIWTGVMIHADRVFGERDLNDDGFRDFPQSSQLNFMNRWKLIRRKFNSQLGIHLAEEITEGGEMGVDPTEPNGRYGIRVRSTFLEVFGKTGLLFPSQPHKGIGTMYSVSRSEIESNYGDKTYDGTATRVYLSAMYQTRIGGNENRVLFAGSYVGNFQEEAYLDSAFSRNEHVPGISGEYTFTGISRTTMVLGARLDHHNMVGLKGVGRIHIKIDPDENSSLRVTAGNGWRLPSVFAENVKMYPSSRTIIQQALVSEEESYALGLTYTRDFRVGNIPFDLGLDFFRTEFVKQIIVDYDKDYQRVYLYNLDGRSYSNSFQAQLGGKPVKGLNFTLAYKWYDVQMQMEQGLNRAPFIPEHRAFLQVGYATPFDRWTLDLTLNWFGSKRIPAGNGRPYAYSIESSSPDFFTANFQATRKLRWFDIYGGIENITDTRQLDPIVDPGDPFGPNFDAGLAWGPTVGRVFYLGLRFTIE